MKHLFRFTTCCLLAAVASLAAGCSDDDSNTPGGGGEGSAITIAAKHALGARTENAASDNAVSYRIVMSESALSGTAEAPKLSAAGQFVTILLYGAEQQENTLPEGTYTLTDATPAAGQGALNACRLETTDAQGNAGASSQALLSGTVKVSHTAAGYKIELSAGLSQQRTLTCTYEGAIDFGAKPGPTPTYDVNLTATFALGSLFPDALDTGESDFFLSLSDVEMDGDAEEPFFGGAGQYVQLDFCALERDPGMLPEGSYNFVSDPADMVGMIDYSGYNTTDEDGDPTSPELTSFTELTATVTYTDEGYRIEATGMLADGRSIRITYEGFFDFEEGSGGGGLPGLTGDVNATLTISEAIYRGITEEEETARYRLDLYDNDIEQNLVTTNRLTLDLYAEVSETPLQLAAGTYEVEGSLFAGTLRPGRLNLDTFQAEGSYCEQTVVENGDITKMLYGMIQGGTVTIDVAGDQYTVTADLVDADGNTIKGTFTGAVTVKDRSYFSNLESDYTIDLTGLPCDVEYYADSFGIRGDNWFVFIGTQEPGSQALRIDLAAPMAGFEGGLPAGEYVVDKLKNFNNNLLCVPGRTDDVGTLFYSWYMTDFKQEIAMTCAPFTTGKVVVARNGDQYTVTLDIYDDSPTPHRITGGWTGTPNVIDKSAGMDDPIPSGHKFAPVLVSKSTWAAVRDRSTEHRINPKALKRSRW